MRPWWYTITPPATTNIGASHTSTLVSPTNISVTPPNIPHPSNHRGHAMVDSHKYRTYAVTICLTNHTPNTTNPIHDVLDTTNNNGATAKTTTASTMGFVSLLSYSGTNVGHHMFGM